jgi:predicted transcriptional regulator
LLPALETIPVKPERKAQLEEFARLHGRDPVEVADGGLGRYLDYEAWFSEQVDEGVAAADRDEFIGHEAVGDLIRQRCRA